MSINRNRAKFNKAHDNQEYRRIFLLWYYPPYWDDYGNHGHGASKYREYRSWKYTRKTQWKS